MRLLVPGRTTNAMQCTGVPVPAAAVLAPPPGALSFDPGGQSRPVCPAIPYVNTVHTALAPHTVQARLLGEAGMAGQHGQINADVMKLAAAADTAGSASAVHSFSSLLSQLIASSQVRAECANLL